MRESFKWYLLDIDLTHPFLLADSLDLIPSFVRESNARRHSINENKRGRRV